MYYVPPRNIPSSVRKLETLGKYIEVGDELRCLVEPRLGPGLAFQEEGEEGALEQVTINPTWLAKAAVKLQVAESPEKTRKSPEKLGDFLKERSSSERLKSSVEKEKSSPEKEEVNPFYSEGEEEEEEVEEKLPEPVNVTETETEDEENNKKTSVPDDGEHNGVEEISEEQESPEVAKKESKTCTKSNGGSKEEENEEEEADGDKTADEDMLELEANPDEFEDMDLAKAATPPTEVEVIECEDEEDVEEVEKKEEVAADKSAGVGEPLPPGEEVAAISLPVEVEAPGDAAVRARLVQFKKSSSVGARGKVVAAVAEVVEGESEGARVTLTASCLHAWGRHLARANLMYHLRLHEPLLLDLQPRYLTRQPNRAVL